MVASKLPQILQLNPTTELVFQGPFDKVVTSFLELKNPSDQRVCFKVKTTAPRRYCVRPNSGIVEPDEKRSIAIMLQPMEPESYSERNKHKFMVQSTIVPRDDETGVFDDIWANASPDQIMDSKLKCTFTESADNEPPQIDTSTPDVIGSLKITSTPTAIKQTSTPTSAPGKQATSQQQSQTQQQQQQQQQNQSSPLGRGLQKLPQQQQQQQPQQQLMSSFHDSFHQTMSDDKKIVLVSLLMLVLGVILGKYII